MNGKFLDIVTAHTRKRVASVKTTQYARALRRKVQKRREAHSPFAFSHALAKNGRTNIIAEIKRASPSKGLIKADIDAAAQAVRYVAGGAAAVSVLTEPEHFRGSIDDLLTVRKAVTIPVLRKDFIVDEFQILEAAAAGADAVLLIVAALRQTELLNFRKLADELGLDALVEVHNAQELLRAEDAGSTIIGVNNRDLNSMDVSLDVSRQLAAGKPEGLIFVAESGLRSRAEIDELQELGFDAFLIGETLMRCDDPVRTLRELGA